MNKKYTYYLKGLDCANCALKIEDALNKEKDISKVKVSFTKEKLSLETENINHLKKVEKIIKKIEPDVTLYKDEIKEEYKINKLNLVRVIFGIVIGSFYLFTKDINLQLWVIIISYLILLPRTLIKALKILIRNKSLDENILITISVIGAFLIKDYFEGFMVIALYEIGKTLEELAVSKSKKSVKELMDIKPEYANIKINDEIKEVLPEEVKIGDIIVVKVGEKIPLDGIVIKGETHLNSAALTGESKPLLVKKESKVLSGSINLTNLIEVKVTSSYENSTVSKILKLVENAIDRKAKAENFVSKAAKIYTPLVIILAILTGVLFPLLTNLSINESVYRALSFLVISCPCAIAISVPLGYFSGIGLSSKKGILIKGSDFLDNIRHIKTVVFDKTGTLTSGKFKVSKVVLLTKEYTEEEVIKICAHGESLSNHPIAKSLIEYYDGLIFDDLVKNYKEIAGIGIEFNYENLFVKIGNNKNLEEDENSTVLYININNKLVSKIIINDKIKEGADKLIYELHRNHIKTYLFTGDNKKSAIKVANELGIKEVYSEMLPDDKYNKLSELILNNKEKNHKIAFVGDGINDAPVLTLADIGISMGGVGSASAIEASDVVLMTDEVSKIWEAFKISKVTSVIIKQNLIFSIGIKLIFIVLNLLGFSTMSWAVFADVGVTVIAILNSIRILKK
jgi:heavy metal-(Cd/Co/Hg/Pb/Zn)-translocating P-type ATPase